MTCRRQGRASDPPGRPTVALKMCGSLPAVALSSREARDSAPCNAPRSVRPVFLGAALVGWCQTMNMKRVLARLSRAASGRHARRSPFICSARRVSPLFVSWAHEVSNERRAQVVVPAGIEPARRHYFQAHRRGTRTPSLTERNGTIHGPATRFPLHSSHGEGEMPLAKVLAIECGTCHADRYISRPTRPCHLLGIGIYRARLNPVLGRLNPSLCRQGKSSVFLHGTSIKSVLVSFNARPSRTACALSSRHLRAASVRFFW